MSADDEQVARARLVSSVLLDVASAVDYDRDMADNEAAVTTACQRLAGFAVEVPLRGDTVHTQAAALDGSGLMAGAFNVINVMFDRLALVTGQSRAELVAEIREVVEDPWRMSDWYDDEPDGQG